MNEGIMDIGREKFMDGELKMGGKERGKVVTKTEEKYSIDMRKEL